MNHDPILHAIWLRIHRTLLFVVLACLLAAGLWGWSLLEWFAYTWNDLLWVTKASLTAEANNRPGALILRLCGVVGVETIAVVYLLVALWWRRSGDVHRRGTRFLDRRED